MPAIAIKGSLGSGHGSFPPRPSVTGEPLLSCWLPARGPSTTHTDGHSAHAGTAVSGRPWFTVNGKGVCCVGDAVSCGSVIVSGDALVQVS